ncbi:MAG: hypothetical protein ACE5G8_14705 [Anaerolineae bacterium]
MSAMLIHRVRSNPWPPLAGLGAALALLLRLSPTDQTLGQTVKPVYLHGALVRTAMILFALSLPVNLAALLWPQKGWVAWGTALVWGAVAVWLAHTLFSMITTYVAWGVPVAWFEPRTRFTFAVAGAGLVFLAVTAFVGHARFSALAFVILGGIVLSLLPRLGIVQHPLDPIGTSSSNAIKGYYAAILIVTLLMGGVLVAWLKEKLAAGRL